MTTHDHHAGDTGHAGDTAHTAHRDHTGHLSPDTLADLHEGLLDDKAVRGASDHLAGCPACQAARDALHDVTALLAAAPAVAPMPDDLVRRLDDAIRAEGGDAPVSAPAAATVTALPLQPGSAGSTPARSPWSTRLLQAAAVLVLVAAGVGIGYGALHDDDGSGGGASSTAADAAGGSAADGAYEVTASGRDYTPASLRAAVPALLSGRLERAGGQKAPQVAPGTDTSGSTGSGASGSPAPAGTPSAAADRLRDPAALATCLANIGRSRVAPLAVDLAQFQGRPATVIVLPGDPDPAFLDVYVVEPACPVGTWLDLEKRVPRP